MTFENVPTLRKNLIFIVNCVLDKPAVEPVGTGIFRTVFTITRWASSPAVKSDEIADRRRLPWNKIVFSAKLHTAR